MSIKFSIIVVCLNPGTKLDETLNSIFEQSYNNYEIIVKDGLSKDDSIERIRKIHDDRLMIVEKQDKSIYDAMNQAISLAGGAYYFFLNCGDRFYSKDVLQKIAHFIEEDQSANKITCDIVYGNIYNEQLKTEIYSTPGINGFTCFRNVPCHQACFYRAEMFCKRLFYPEYKVRADYEHFLWCYYKAHARILPSNVMISIYEGAGFSETKENIKRSKREHKEITKLYMSRLERFRYQMALFITLAPLRRKLAEGKRTTTLYNALKRLIYRK